MSKEEEEEMYSIWVNWEKRIISFEKVEGFQELQYKTHDEMFRFALRIQFQSKCNCIQQLSNMQRKGETGCEKGNLIDEKAE